jgi:hypothetical protein
VGVEDSPGQSQGSIFAQMLRTLMTGELYISIILASKCLSVKCSYISHVCALLLLLILRWGMFHERDEIESRCDSALCYNCTNRAGWRKRRRPELYCIWAVTGSNIGRNIYYPDEGVRCSFSLFRRIPEIFPKIRPCPRLFTSLLSHFSLYHWMLYGGW